MTPACDSVRRARPLLGTFVEISASGTRSGALHAAVNRAFDIVADVHRLMSFHDRDSDVAKGFAVDRAVEALQALGVPHGLVNAGGDIAAFGADPFTVHIRDPRDAGRILTEVHLHNEAIASSGAALDRPAGAPRVAIVDPSTGRFANTIAGATVRVSRCVVADALTKLVVVAGRSADALLTRYGASALLVPWHGDVLATRSWGKELRPAS